MFPKIKEDFCGLLKVEELAQSWSKLAKSASPPRCLCCSLPPTTSLFPPPLCPFSDPSQWCHVQGSQRKEGWGEMFGQLFVAMGGRPSSRHIRLYSHSVQRQEAAMANRWTGSARESSLLELIHLLKRACMDRWGAAGRSTRRSVLLKNVTIQRRHSSSTEQSTVLQWTSSVLFYQAEVTWRNTGPHLTRKGM